MIKRQNRKLLPFIRIGIVIIIILLFLTIFAFIGVANSNIISHVSIDGIDVSGLSRQEAETLLQDRLDGITDDELTLKHDNIEETIKLSSLELKADIVGAVSAACKLGRDSNIFANNYKIITAFIHGEDIPLTLTFNNEIIDNLYYTLDEQCERQIR